MEHTDFHIGLEFLTSSGCVWRCTDVGTRTIVAIQIEEGRADWYSGPPYAVEETVFDENDLPDCYRKVDFKPE